MKSDDFFLTVSSFGPALNLHNHKLNNYILNNGGRSIDRVVAGDFFRTMGNIGRRWELGGYFGYITDHDIHSFNGINVGIITGARVVQNEFFHSSIIGQAGLFGVSIYGVQPSTIVTRNVGDHLNLSTFSYGLSSISYFKLASWFAGREYSLHLGVEVGVIWVANTTWEYGQERGGKYGNFDGVKVSEVPSFDSQYEYLRFSLAFKMP